jgi:hypothetical protein
MFDMTQLGSKSSDEGIFHVKIFQAEQAGIDAFDGGRGKNIT